MPQTSLGQVLRIARATNEVKLQLGNYPDLLRVKTQVTSSFFKLKTMVALFSLHRLDRDPGSLLSRYLTILHIRVAGEQAQEMSKQKAQGKITVALILMKQRCNHQASEVPASQQDDKEIHRNKHASL